MHSRDPGERVALYDDLLLLRSPDPSGLAAANAYALLAGDHALLVDAVHQQQLAQVRALRAEGRRPAGLVLTHRHVVAQGNVLRALVAELRIPVYLHPLEVAHRQARNKGIAFLDPCAPGALPARFGAQALLFPGHTAGHVVVYWNAHGGVLFCGDCARGAGEEGRAPMQRTPAGFSDDDGELARSWAAFRRPVAGCCPLYGAPVLDRADLLPGVLRGLYGDGAA